MEHQVFDQSIIMQDLGPISTERSSTDIPSSGKEKEIYLARLDYIKMMLQIETDIPSRSQGGRQVSLLEQMLDSIIDSFNVSEEFSGYFLNSLPHGCEVQRESKILVSHKPWGVC
ncbi:hypothetical protein TNCV_1727391 [Trichonephila clavipes]|nr:hypothetical protein TNCV_1727391 [Trichonephila clavipes]